MDQYITPLRASPPRRSAFGGSFSSSPLRQSTGARKVSLFSDNGSRRSSITADSEAAPPQAAESGVNAGILRQSLAKHQQELDAARATGRSRDDSDRKLTRPTAPPSSVFNPGRRRMSLQEDPRRIADYKLHSTSSSTLSGTSCTSSPEAITSTTLPGNAASSVSREPIRTTPGARRAFDYKTFSSSSSPSSSTSLPVDIRSGTTVRTSPSASAPPPSAQHKDKERERIRRDQDGERSFVVFVNTKSGAQKGEDALEMLIYILGEDRVFDLVELDDLQACLERFRQEKNLCIVVGGGDGTYSSILNALIKMKFEPMPMLATLPMGTGNDLAREFGWGGGFDPNEEAFEDMFDRFQRAEPSPLDIWRVDIKPQKEIAGEYRQSETTTQYMFNYFNMGFDAHVALGFDKSRKSWPCLFRAQWINKLFYLCSVPKPVVTGRSELYNCVMVEVDEDPVQLPKDLRTLVTLNFTCYQAGLDIWGSAREAESAAGYPVLWSTPAMDDSIFEVVGLGGLDHEAAVRTNMSKGYRLAQGSTIKLRILDDVAINIDGEPHWQRAPCDVVITRWGSIQVLRCPEESKEEEEERKKRLARAKKAPKIRIGKTISKKRTARRRTTGKGPQSSWNKTAKFSLPDFLLYMLTGRV